MKIELTGKVALVTGSTEGIGFAVAAGLAEAGADVVVNGRTADKVDAAVARLKEMHPEARVTSLASDLGTASGCEACVSAWPDIDILINNVGIYGPKSFFDIGDEEWSRYFEVNVRSGVRLSRAYLKGMLDRDWGRIIFISSESGLNIPADMLHYGVTKTAMLAVSRGLAKVAQGTGVTVNSVLPGPTLTEGVARMLEPAASQTGKTIEEVGANFVVEKRSTSLIRRLASSEEVANMVVYACSTQASATTGAALRVDGGAVDSIG